MKQGKKKKKKHSKHNDKLATKEKNVNIVCAKPPSKKVLLFSHVQ